MLRSLKDLEQYNTTASDGAVGKVVNFLLDDEWWAIRYLVVETGHFFDGHEVLISPVSFGAINWSTWQFHLALTMERIKHSPAVETALPVSRQREREHFQYYGYPYYWGSSGVWGMAPDPGSMMAGNPRQESARDNGTDDADIHLRSAKELRGYHIQGTDGVIGHVQDFIVDDVTWEVRYLVIDTSPWWFGRMVLVSPLWAGSVSWDRRKICLDLTRQQIKDCPPWNPDAGVNREYETCLYDYYGRPAYWNGTAPEPGKSPHPLTGEPR
jgi:sporulation protein YlmC with PRC-barrel domain